MKKAVALLMLLCLVLTGCGIKTAEPIAPAAPPQDIPTADPSQIEPAPEIPADAEVHEAAVETSGLPETPVSGEEPVPPVEPVAPPDTPAVEPSQTEPAPEIPADAEVYQATVEPGTQPEIPWSEDPIQPEPAPVVTDMLEQIRSVAKAEGCLISVAYVGFDFDTLADELDVNGIMAAYPCTPETVFVDAGGEDAYVLIPTDPEAKVRIYTAELTGDGELLPTDEVLYEGGGAPVILRCNVSDIMPNVVVRVEDSEGRSLDASPSLSLRDGSVSMEGAYDFTTYPEGFVREED